MSPVFRVRLDAATAAIAEARQTTRPEHVRQLISEARTALSSALEELDRVADPSGQGGDVTRLREAAQ